MINNKILKKNFLFFVYPFYLLLLIEITARLYLVGTEGVSFFEPKQIIYNYYFELRPLKDLSVTREDGFFDVLILGGSVLHKDWGAVEDILRENFTANGIKNVRIHNLAMRAHSSLDSYYKYKQLQGKRFDLVLLYHGINEVRANNCPDDIFKKDYSHYIWYEEVNIFDKHGEMNFVTFPFFFERLGSFINKKMHPSQYIPKDVPKAEWVEFGQKIKTKESFQHNMRRILEMARDRGDPMVLMTFAFYAPQDYVKRHDTEFCDLPARYCPTEIWGKPENVVETLQVHNNVIEDLAKRYSDVLFVDQNQLIPKNEKHFNDICHLSFQGSERFVDNIMRHYFLKI